MTSANHTSSPLNQFTLGRSRDRPNENTVVLSFFSLADGIDNKLQTHGASDQITLSSADGNPFMFLFLFFRHYRGFYSSGEPALVHVHQSILAAPLLLLTLLHKPGLPTVFTVHNNFKNYSRRNKLLSAVSFLLADLVTFVSHDAKSEYPDVLKQFRAGSWEVVQNGVDVHRVDRTLDEIVNKNEWSGLTPDSVRSCLDLVTIGRIIPQKNQIFLIDVLSRVRSNIHLTVIGEGPLREDLEARSEELEVAGRIHFTGLLPRDDVYARLHDADIFVSAARWEGLPVAVMEAMAVGLPVLLSDIPPHRELVVSGGRDAGPIILPESYKKWAEEIEGLKQTECEVRGRRCRGIVERHFSLQKMQKEYDKVYQKTWNIESYE